MKLDRVVEWILERLGKVPTTQLIVCSGIGAFLGTIALWWLLALLHAVYGERITAWEPSASMIAFISGWGVIAATQFGMKRATDSGYAAAKKGNGPPASEPVPESPAP